MRNYDKKTLFPYTDHQEFWTRTYRQALLALYKEGGPDMRKNTKYAENRAQAHADAVTAARYAQ